MQRYAPLMEQLLESGLVDKDPTPPYNPRDHKQTAMNPILEKGLIGAAVLAGLVLLLPMAKQSKEFINCVNNAETGISNLSGKQFTDLDGKGGFIERPVAVHYCNGGDVTKYLKLTGQ